MDMAAAVPPSSAETAALLPVFVPSEAPEMTAPTVEPPSLASDRRVPRYVRGAAAKVPAWTFGNEWARYHFRGKWKHHMVSGTFVHMLEPEWGLFVWDDPEDAPSDHISLDLDWLFKPYIGVGSGCFWIQTRKT